TVTVPSRGDGCVIVRLGRRHDPRMTARAEPAYAPEHRSGRSEVGEDHVERAPAFDVAADASPPAVAHAQRTGELPLQRSAPLAVFADQPPDRPQLRTLASRPAEERIEIAAGGINLWALDPEPQV